MSLREGEGEGELTCSRGDCCGAVQPGHCSLMFSAFGIGDHMRWVEDRGTGRHDDVELAFAPGVGRCHHGMPFRCR
jgi:hypothetical protein